MGATQPIREEHRELLPHIEAIRACAEATDREDADLTKSLDDVLRFLHQHLVPHARAEEAALYPSVEQVMNAPGATATMSRDHHEVVALTHELELLRGSLSDPPTAGQRRDLQRVLYGLYAIVKLHFAKEEEIYLPVLDERLAPDEAARMIEQMHAAAGGHTHG